MTRRTTNEVHPSQQSQLSAGSVRFSVLPHCIIAQSSSSSSLSLEWKDNMTYESYELLQPPAEADAVSVEDQRFALVVLGRDARDTAPPSHSREVQPA